MNISLLYLSNIPINSSTCSSNLFVSHGTFSCLLPSFHAARDDNDRNNNNNTPQVRALKMHGGGPPKVSDPVYKSEGLDLLSKGVCNLQHHVKSCKKYGIKVRIVCFCLEVVVELKSFV